MAIKMRVNQNSSSKCCECNCGYNYTPEMYDLCITDNVFTLCKSCVETIERKTIKASCIYNGKVKSKEDMARITNYNLRTSPKLTVETKTMPKCYGEFLKQTKCKSCSVNKECKDVYKSEKM